VAPQTATVAYSNGSEGYTNDALVAEAQGHPPI
jgi:hypothetical protein